MVTARSGHASVPTSHAHAKPWAWHPLAKSGHVARADLHVAFVAPGVDPAIGHGIFHCTMVFVRVGAIGKAAAAYVGSQFAEVTGDFFRDHVPKLKLANAGRVDDVAAERQRDELGGCGRVAPLLGFFAHRLYAQCQARLDCVQQRRLADAALARDHAFCAGQTLTESVDADAASLRKLI